MRRALIDVADQMADTEVRWDEDGQIHRLVRVAFPDGVLAEIDL